MGNSPIKLLFCPFSVYFPIFPCKLFLALRAHMINIFGLLRKPIVSSWLGFAQHMETALIASSWLALRANIGNQRFRYFGLLRKPIRFSLGLGCAQSNRESAFQCGLGRRGCAPAQAKLCCAKHTRK